MLIQFWGRHWPWTSCRVHNVFGKRMIILCIIYTGDENPCILLHKYLMITIDDGRQLNGNKYSVIVTSEQKVPTTVLEMSLIGFLVNS